ncbi:AAA domain-containing protein [Nocardia abscessus]|uniref:AAA domain-containing protein n=1 Tax=Nocardia abscessus TaxID=120957 RepID=UPI002453AFAC|nr:AAA domain-containing protein [Nocardia abscessus]
MTGVLRRRALLIGNEHYTDHRFAPLPSVRADISLLGQVLLNRQIGAFADVRPVADCTAERMCNEIGDFLEGCDEDELALVYISGHGTRLAQSTGEFQFIATDSDFDNVAATAVGAGFVNTQLEQCVAPQKLLMIDCCRSGGFALGLRTEDRTAKGINEPRERPPVEGRGVFVLSSSRASEDSFAGSPDTAVITPSVFTGEIVEALRNGDAAKPETGEVTVDDLFDYVNQRMRIRASQVPVKSAVLVDDRIVIASRPQGPPTLTAVSRRTDGERDPSPERGPAKSASLPTWPQLLAYYRSCLSTGHSAMPTLSVDDHGVSHVCLVGLERFLSGTLDADHRVAVPSEAVDLVDQATAADDELWAGYPAVVLQNQPKGRNRVRRRFAPLLVRRIEAVPTEHGIRLEPTGPVVAHPGLVEERLGEGTAAAFNEQYRPTWHAGQHALMANDIGKVLTQELEIECVQKLRPDQLADHIDADIPQDGARNAAVLFRVRRSSNPTSKLLDDFDSIEQQVSKIKDTALAALSPDLSERTRHETETRPFQLATPLPCNEAQEAVLRSAMSRRLTIATGPPGTGKSQLVTNLVATAVTNSQTVLVASTNNQAVDEVWDRCEKLSSGSMIRTGNVEYRRVTEESLRALLKASAPESTPTTTATALRHAEQILGIQHDLLRDVARVERELLDLGRVREAQATRLHLSVADLVSRLEGTRADSIARQAKRVSTARLFPNARQSRLLRRWRIPESAEPAAERCAALAEFAIAEHGWRALRERIDHIPVDTELLNSLRAAEYAVREASTASLDNTVRSNAELGHRAITDLIDANADGRTWRAIKTALPVVRAWAVSTLSARYFTPAPALFDLVVIDEASQCSIPQILPLLFRARRALIIGDPMQLPHIAGLDADEEARAARSSDVSLAWLESHRMSYRRHSGFRAGERAAGGHLLLDEHFRCHPSIAELVNELFYEGRLTVMTDVRGRPTIADRAPIHWTHVAGAAEQPLSGKSWINRAEVNTVVTAVRFLLEPGRMADDTTVGVVTPFKAQAEVIRQQLGRNFDHVRVGTVHTFQGGECDIMIYSLVAAPGMPSGSVNWIDNQLNLWNVAITRARSHLVMVGNRELWSRRRIGAALLNSAGGATESSDNAVSDELYDRLYDLASRRPGSKVELREIVCGHRTDAVIRWDDDSRTAIVLDPGASDGQEHARHLRLMLARRELREDPAHHTTSIRLPAWRLYDTAEERFFGQGW